MFALDASLRAIGVVAFLAFAGVDAWYIVAIKKAQGSTDTRVNWRKEATIIALCIGILLALFLKHLYLER